MNNLKSPPILNAHDSMVHPPRNGSVSRSIATIISGTTASGTNATTIYTPLSSTNAFLIRDPVLASEPNLLRISSATLPTGASALAASSVSSSAPSTNNRFIATSRWNQIVLRTGAISAATTPNWILVTRSGPKSSVALADAGNQSGSNCVIGRYAYAVYDEGSLLDINLAGYPDAAASETAKKGPSSFANLAAAGIAGLTSAWTNWRNLFVTSGTSYVNEVLIAESPTPVVGGLFYNLSFLKTGLSGEQAEASSLRNTSDQPTLE